jgi:GDP-L-fucose synthase
MMFLMGHCLIIKAMGRYLEDSSLRFIILFVSDKYRYKKTMEKTSKIFVAGHRGLVGSAIVRELEQQGYKNILKRSRAELDLLRQSAVEDFFEQEKPEYVFLAAARVGGILANDIYRGDFILENLQIQNNVIGAAFKFTCKKLLFLGSSCIYPKLSPQPIPEEALLTGSLEPTNEAYALAKIAGLMLCKSLKLQHGVSFISAMPTNMYGPGDNYDLANSHVLPALIRKFHEAKLSHSEFVTLWGTGKALREFLFSDDLADALIFLMKNYDDVSHINVGSGIELSINELALLVKDVVGYSGQIKWDTSKPDGTPRKLMNSEKLFSLGWKPKVNLKEGITSSYEDFKQRYCKV